MATLLPLPQVLAGLLGQLGVPEPPGIPRKNLPPKSQGLRGEPGAELGAGIPALPGLSATSHQKSPPSLYPGPGLLHRQQRNSPLASEQSRKRPQGRGCRGTETSGVAPGAGSRPGLRFLGEPFVLQRCPMSSHPPGRGHGEVLDPPAPGAAPTPLPPRWKDLAAPPQSQPLGGSSGRGLQAVLGWGGEGTAAGPCLGPAGPPPPPRRAGDAAADAARADLHGRNHGNGSAGGCGG